MKQMIEVDINFFEHLLNCMLNQKFLHEQSKEERERNQRVIDEALQKGMDLIQPIIQKNQTSQLAIDRYIKKWNEDIYFILKKIQASELDDIFKWDHLVKQECEMYCVLAEQVDKKEFDALCKRRGFNEDMKKYIIDMMKHVGLGNKL